MGQHYLTASLTVSSPMPTANQDEQKVAAKPLADPDALVPGVPDHVKRPEIDPMPPVAVSAKQRKKEAKRRVKAIKRRLRS